MIHSGSSPFTIREPDREELGRAIYLFRKSPLPAQARIFTVSKNRPVERFVAAVAWWMEGPVSRFKLTTPPGLAGRNDACALLIDRVTDCCRKLGIKPLCYSELLTDDSEWIPVLEEHGFSRLRSERFFEISTVQSWTRTMDMFEKYRADIPKSWRTESIRNHAPDVILDLIAPHHLMPVEELRHAWRPDSPQGFHLDYSSILFEDSRPIGVLLLRQVLDAFCVDVRVVQSENRLLRSLGNVMLFHHVALRHGRSGPMSRLQFRGGEIEHRETANLALRMGGRELPPRHVFAKTL